MTRTRDHSRAVEIVIRTAAVTADSVEAPTNHRGPSMPRHRLAEHARQADPVTKRDIPQYEAVHDRVGQVRKLIEVEFPLDAVNQAGHSEKSVPRRGLPATMHLWWSRKPTGVARAVIFASLIDEPLDRIDLWPDREIRQSRHDELTSLVEDLAHWDCPVEVLERAHTILREQFGSNLPIVVDPFCGGGAIPYAATTIGLRTRAIDLNPVATITTRAITEIPRKVADLGPVHPHAVTRHSDDDHSDGNDDYASTSSSFRLHGRMVHVGQDVGLYGHDLITEVQRRIGRTYPPIEALDGSPTRAVSYLWARTAQCANPNCQGEIPLLSTWWLSKKTTNQWHVRPKSVTPTPSAKISGHKISPTDDNAKPGRDISKASNSLYSLSDRNLPDRVEFEVVRGPKPDDLEDLKVGHGANYRCPFCHEVTTAESIRHQGNKQGLGLRLVAIQAFADPTKPRSGRAWTNPSQDAESAALDAWPKDRRFPFAEQVIPPDAGNISAFGVTHLEGLLTPRQRLLMTTACEVLAELRHKVLNDALTAGLDRDQRPLHKGGSGAIAYADAITTYLAITISRMANRVSTMTVHNRANGSVEQSFVQPGYAFYGDFPEADPFSGSTGSWENALRHVIATVSALPVGPGAQVFCKSASEGLTEIAAGQPLEFDPRDESASPPVAISTDPPYYDMFDYAALSELFFPWLRLALREVWPVDTEPQQSPVADQIISAPKRFRGDRAAAHDHFETMLTESVKAMTAVHDRDIPMTIYYGYQQTQHHIDGRTSTAWAALLNTLVTSGLTVVRTWPLRTERPEGVKVNSNALASSILLVCRKRPPTSTPANRDQVEAELRQRIPLELASLKQHHIAPVDLAQSIIGPAMEVWTSHESVTDLDGNPVSADEALRAIYKIMDEALLSHSFGFDPQTRWAIEWFTANGNGRGSIDTAKGLADEGGTSLADLLESGIATIDAGQIRLTDQADIARMAVSMSKQDHSETHETTWVSTHVVAELLLKHSPERAHEFLTAVVDKERESKKSTLDDIRDLAYHLYFLCNQHGLTTEARTWNVLVRSWRKLTG